MDTAQRKFDLERLFTPLRWRRLLRDGSLEAEAASAQLLPVRIGEATIEADRFVRPYPGTIHIELGRARVRLECSVDPASLRLILEHLGR